MKILFNGQGVKSRSIGDYVFPIASPDLEQIQVYEDKYIGRTEQSQKRRANGSKSHLRRQ